MVKAKAVESWKLGLQHTLTCTVGVPYYIQLSSESDARLLKILPSGSTFNKGDLLAVQDDSYSTIDLEILEKQSEIQNITSVYNTAEYERGVSLQYSNISKSQMSGLQLAKDLAKFEADKQGIAIKEKKRRIGSLQHVAPLNGTVVALQSHPGEYLIQGANILTYAANELKELNCEMPLEEITRLKEARRGLEDIQLQWHTGLVIDRLSQKLSSNSQMVSVYLKGDLDSQMLGERVLITMYSPMDNLSLVPAEALIISKASSFVWFISENNKIEKVDVSIIKNLAHHFLVQSKLKGGDRLVSLGKNQLEPGQTVRVIP